MGAVIWLETVQGHKVPQRSIYFVRHDRNAITGEARHVAILTDGRSYELTAESHAKFFGREVRS